MKLITFPGQGTPISIPVLKAVIRNKSSSFDKILHKNLNSNDLLNYIINNPSSPGSIAVCSNFYYQLYSTSLSESKPLLQDNQLLLGHSLGELTCLSLNSLFSLKDLFDIANYRNELMVNFTGKYLTAHRLNGTTKFEMWALSSPFVENLPNEIFKLLSKSPSFSSHFKSVSIANSNSVKQCVVTGLIADLESLRTEINYKFPRLRITELTNPDNIAFHNNTVLRPIQEPLYDFIWNILKKNQTHTLTELNSPIISNYDGRISYFVHHAIEKFVKASSNTVQFTKCYDTINSLPQISDDTSGNIDDNVDLLDEAICMGPGNVIYNLIRRNCTVKAHQYNSVGTIDEFNELHNVNSESK
ncbi:hypothetical protein Kpol_1072p35 [Vanderwaltozyma polyspora DSM 70294]|uniref:[acyl-carrier-protein] S-malonyltransferase n=1 Tax=Vanderwaltozyma polyspora (strain ATCC 22028 / DSM 70294 / BCRC 21397 / CBS 2163 / NBRC 10782 / NRRL Y-8283 / UCD 57-17) TaxID=436907 RepID=A7TKQ3_VANPO|nr:uncharacterized protein Kpol_1072p35 [Vanderwaltozyma polyspora DSM 70294]EDO17165.1 hypothetical protein Kpol_1072p35 [Vanderwaltozyma polyspora DSM 70294]